MRLDEQYFEDFRCVVCDGKPFDAKDGTLSGLYGIEDLVDECCVECGHIMSRGDLEAMTHAAEIHMINSLFSPN
jgi:hypothetical protein